MSNLERSLACCDVKNHITDLVCENHNRNTELSQALQVFTGSFELEKYCLIYF